MRVSAYLFNPPGLGEFLTKHFTMPDSAMPTTTEEFALRSVRAMKHFWPTCITGKATTLKLCEHRTVVEGATWQIEWATDAHVAAMEVFVEKHLNETSSLGDLIRAAAFIQPTKELSL